MNQSSQLDQLDRREFCTAMAAGAALVGAAGAIAPKAASAEEAKPADAPAEAAEATEQEPIWVYVVDRIVTKPGDGEAFLNDYLTIYAPMAQACYAELVSTLVAPPIWMPNATNTLTFAWKVAGIGGCWGIASPLRSNPDALAWWDSVRERVVSQDRSYFAAPQDMEALNNV